MQRRITRNKEKILKLFRQNHLLSLPELAKKLPQIDYSTLYRNVHRFLEDGVLKAITIESAAYFELTHEDSHQHFLCTSCQTVSPLEIKKPMLKKMFPKNFYPISVDVVARGACGNCRRR